MKYPNVIFAGGGSRCFWQLGFWEGARAGGLDLGSGLDFAGATSAGCATATAAILGRSYEALEIFKDLTGANPRNIHWRHFRPGSGAPVLPHSRMYREGLDRFLDDAGLEELRRSPLTFLMTGYPRLLSGALAAAFGFFVYAVEKRVLNPVHPQWTGKLGYHPVLGSARDCASKEAFIEMVLAASCVPPVLPGGQFRGRRVLDGGLVDNAPVLLSRGRPGNTLVLLSRQYRTELPNGDDVTYAQPSQPIAIDKFDYANPTGLQTVFDLGIEDGTRFAASALSA
jgi:hypothetical protein